MIHTICTPVLILCASIVLIVLSQASLAADKEASSLPRSTPEAQGISSAGILAFVEAVDRQVIKIHSIMIVRHGHVVAEGWWKPNSADTTHIMNSLSKSFTSTAVGLAIWEGKLSLDDQVLKFFPDESPNNPSENLKSMRVRDLLSMSAGHETEAPIRDSKEISWVKTFLSHPVPFKPGTHFLYNTPGSYMLSAIVQKVTGKTVYDYLQPRLFKPLGIENATWEKSPQGINLGGWGLYVRTEDIAKFGLLYLHKGVWHGKQLIPRAWVEASISRQTSNGSNPNSDWDQGYGYQFWRCRHRAFRGDGAGGQFCVVMPEQDVVIAITADTSDMQSELNLVWDKLLPAIQHSALPENKEAQNKLKQVLADLTTEHTIAAK